MTDPKQIAETVARLRRRPLYEGHGEASDLPDEAADLLQFLAAENAALKAEAEAVAADRDDADAWAKQHHADLLRAEAERDRLATELAGAYPLWKHIKRGTIYREHGRGQIQTDTPLPDCAEVVIYRGEHDGRFWIRPVSEFEDGRFHALTTETPT